MSRTTITRIYNRHDTAENWEAKNPILGVGEIGYDTTNKYIKIGNGETKWESLVPYVPAENAFENMSWSQISSISKAGMAKKYFKVGDKKQIVLSIGIAIEVRIIDFDHDDLADGTGKAGITCEMEAILPTISDQQFQVSNYMNTSNTNAGGWDSCYMRKTYLPAVQELLPANLKSVIKKVKKYTSAGSQSSTIVTSEDELFLFSEIEVDFSTTNSFNGEGELYEYYYYAIQEQDPDMLKKYCYGITPWWLRSPYNGNSTSFCIINTSGIVTNSNAIVTSGVSFGFCV